MLYIRSDHLDKENFKLIKKNKVCGVKICNIIFLGGELNSSLMNSYLNSYLLNSSLMNSSLMNSADMDKYGGKVTNINNVKICAKYLTEICLIDLIYLPHLKILTKLTKLQSIELRFITKIKTIKVLKKLKNVERFTIVNCLNLKDISIIIKGKDKIKNDINKLCNTSKNKYINLYVLIK